MTMKIKRLTEPVMGKTKNKISGKESLSDKQSTQQLPSNAKINLNQKINKYGHKAEICKPQWTSPRYNNGDKSPVFRVDESALKTVDETTTEKTMDESIKLRTNPLLKLWRSHKNHNVEDESPNQ